jgi:hypothetical protein
MSLLTGSIEADVPASFAEREWRAFVGRSVYDRFPRGYEDLRSSFAELDADDGLVTIADTGDGRARVSVEVAYTAHDPADPGSDIARAQRELDHDLNKYREFVLRRCDEELCRRN